ncbi:hypothetical protein Q4574_00830 [Aliiglaciecola sp. 3_MG-2023]|uniref:hypothetical protein n=1 Tax=Aliiglaciecola sp. 3_MG-2023 TaxID=3062644 RepID=UPI0026E477D9|nr:hypothetical protein [Aliiglaciecola sp. 3_MG-2023]MDO6691800.1 hypothetical protein [Aliiglaciecola sp. 3_MG-2023]
MKYVQGSKGLDLIATHLRKNQGALLIFKEYCDLYEGGIIHEYNLARMYELLKPLINDPICEFENTTAKNAGALGKKYLVKSRPAHRKSDPTEKYRKGMTIALRYLELKEQGMSFETAASLAGESEFVGLEAAKKFITEYKEKALAHKNHLKGSKKG